MSAELRVLHLATGNLYGGVEVFLHTLARRSADAGMGAEFTVCWSQGRLANELRLAGAAVHDLGGVRLSRPWQVWRARRRLTSLLRVRKFDVAVLHSGWTHAVLGPALRRAGLPLTMVVHTLVPRKSRLERWARRIPLDGVIANSRFTAASARDWYPGWRDAEVILLPVASPPGLSAESQAALRQELGAQTDDCVILQASRMQSLKGQRTLLSALAHLRELPRWQCWLAGGAQRPEERAFVAELHALAVTHLLLDRVRFLGQREDVPALLAAADVVCQVNEEPEAFGLIYLEALAAGKPVIAADQGGVTEVLDATCGALIRPGASAALAELLRQWVSDPALRHRLGQEGLRRAAECCDVRQQTAALRRFLERVVERFARVRS